MYEYKLVPISQWLIKRKTRQSMEEALSEYVQEIINRECKEGWEFYRTDQYTMFERPGCLGELFGEKTKQVFYNLLCFRKKTQEQIENNSAESFQNIKSYSVNEMMENL